MFILDHSFDLVSHFRIEFFETGNTVTLEGTLALDLDFGYGYSYELLLENAKAID